MTGSRSSHGKHRYRVTPTIRRTPPAQHSEFTCRLISGDRNAPGFDVSLWITTRPHRFALTRLSISHLSASRADFSSTLTTTTLNGSRLRWFGASFRQQTPVGLPPSLRELSTIQQLFLKLLICVAAAHFLYASDNALFSSRLLRFLQLTQYL